jgi:hypothetical protein
MSSASGVASKFSFAQVPGRREALRVATGARKGAAIERASEPRNRFLQKNKKISARGGREVSGGHQSLEEFDRRYQR